jgi:hypothetical protein
MSDRQVLQPLVDALLADNRELLDRHMANHGACLADFVWRPDATQLSDAPLSHALEYWQGIRGERALPLASDISPFELRPALGYVLLIDVEDDGWDGRFRLYGTHVAEMYGEDMTGRLVSEIDNNNYATQLFRAVYRVVTLRRQPVFTHHRPPPHISVTAWKRLILPLANGDGAVCRFLSINLPGAWRPTQPSGTAR